MNKIRSSFNYVVAILIFVFLFRFFFLKNDKSNSNNILRGTQEHQQKNKFYYYIPPIEPQNDYYKFTHAYSLWVQPSESTKFQILQNEINLLAGSYNGTNHQPHATLYGAIYTTNESYVIEAARYLATVIKPFNLRYNSMDCKTPNITKRWRSALTIRYKHDKSFMEAAKIAIGTVRAKDYQKPHTSMLYDFEGNAYLNPNIVNESVKRLENKIGHSLSNFYWRADTVSVYYTPLRDHWKSSEDMKAIVNSWYRVASFNMTK